MLVTRLLDYHSCEVLTTVCYHMLAANALHLQRLLMSRYCVMAHRKYLVPVMYTFGVRRPWLPQ